MSNWTFVDNVKDASNLVGGTNTLSMPLFFTPVAGNVGCLSITFYDGTGVAPTITSLQDENGKTYTVTPNSPAPDTAAVAGNVFLAYLIVPSGAGQTITATFSKNFVVAVMHYDEFHLASGTIAFDGDAVSTDGASGATVTTPTVPVTSSDALLFAHAASESNITSVDMPWTAAGIQDALGGFSGYLLGATTNTALAMTQSSTVRYAAAGMSFKAAVTASRPMFRGR